MKRDPRLRDLSDEHHQALVLARHASRAASQPDRLEQERVWQSLTLEFHRDIEPHFVVEETHLLPALDRAGFSDLAERTRVEHAALRRVLAHQELDLAAKLTLFGTLLREHVRFEERELFNVAQESLGTDELEAIAQAQQDKQRRLTRL